MRARPLITALLLRNNRGGPRFGPPLFLGETFMIFLDFEVFTDDEYRLRKGGMTTEDFIRDPRFQPSMLSIA
jgi:hypothetical protein